MISNKIETKSEFTYKSDDEINEFIEKVKQSFENVQIISIENIPMNYYNYTKYFYKIKFYHDLYLKL